MRIVSEQIVSVTDDAHNTEAAVSEMQSVAGTVAEQISALRSVMTRIVRTSSDAANRRLTDRVPLNMPATLIVNGRHLPVICVNLSPSGALVRAEEALVAGTNLVLRLPGLPDLPGTVLRNGVEAGMHFNWPSDTAPVELTDWLGRKAA